ncbi:MAG: LPS assembly protein LptD [Phycisphaeraceae bacterium]
MGEAKPNGVGRLQGRPGRWTTRLLLAAAVLLVCVLPQWSAAQTGLELPETPPLAPPIVESDALLAAPEADAWQADGAQYLYLTGGVSFEVGAYGFEAERAVVRIETEQRPAGPVRHLALYLDDARHLRGGGVVSAEAPRLLVTVSTRGAVDLETDLFQRREAGPDQPLLEQALARFARYDQTLAQPTLSVSDEPLYGPEAAERRAQRQAAIRAERAEALRPEPAAPEEAARAEVLPGEAVLPTRGTLRYNADRLWVKSDAGPDQGAIELIGDVRLMYEDFEENRTFALRAEKAVLLVDMAETDAAPGEPLAAGAVEGVYLEDAAVITAGTYTVRAPRVYYDLEDNRALLLDAVLYSFDVRRQVPLYARAEMLQQTSRRTWEAEDAVLTTSEFAQPHVAIGADRVRIEQLEEEQLVEERFVAEDLTLEVGGVPVFYWPVIAGARGQTPLQSVGFDYDEDDGFSVLTRWDPFALIGKQTPEGVAASLAADYRGDHGPATGAEVEYRRDGAIGEFDSYYLPDDNGEDDIADRRDIEHDGDSRGFLLWRHRHEPQENWTLQLETAYVSDPTFLEEFYREMAYEERPFETSLYLQRREDSAATDLLLRDYLSDFLPQLTELQVPGYRVSKLPELRHFVLGESLWQNRLTWYSENRLSRLRAEFGEDAPADRGFTDAQARRSFGIDADTPFDAAADAADFPTDWRLRADSRQEIVAPMQAGMFNVAPYAVGRVTAYDEDFEAYSGEDEAYRLWGALGVRTHTSVSKTYGDAEIDLLDVNGLRHIVEPSVDVFAMSATLGADDLPVYDSPVEGIAEGTGVRLGLRNTLQTRRGGPGRWRTVDWLTLDSELVLYADEPETENPLPRYYAYRPEYSVGGDHFYSELLWMVSDTFAAVGDLTWDFEADRLAEWRVGASLEHTPRLSTFVNYQDLDPLETQILGYGFTYQLTAKYRAGLAHYLDFGRESGSRRLSGWLERQLPRWRLRVTASYDDIDDDSRVGVVLMPEGLGEMLSPAMLD